ncbi:FecR domain-containing protein [Pedobacter gandavensis]|uniref:FecR domain-containing protein n=1 Tax=Pedobacter gandavensis TaxID=2679963 RepID=UPI00292D0D99|nr:FecR domain-containing protein [Pedobacter gandavensis]
MAIKSQFPQLFKGYISGSLTPEEQQAFYRMADQEVFQEELSKLVDEEMNAGRNQTYILEPSEKQEILHYIFQTAENTGNAPARPEYPLSAGYPVWKKIAIAASLFFTLGTGIYFYSRHSVDQQQLVYLKHMKPGENSATLTLGDGSRIRLNDAGQGQLAEQAGVTIIKSENGALTYKTSPKAGKRMMNTLSTSRGEQFKVILPDGTNVWLNAASSIRYPTTFADAKSRKVSLKGEAYFEVTKDKSHPFVVETNLQEVEVLGTHFNISSYPEEALVKTTLLEGLVKVTPSTTKRAELLKPGYQAQVGANGVNIKAVNTETAVDWINGKFIFENETLASILTKISRWYNISIEYQNESLKQVTFTGTLSRYDQVDKVLSKLEHTEEVKFKVSEGKITVSPK